MRPFSLSPTPATAVLLSLCLLGSWPLAAQPVASPGRPGIPTGLHVSAQIGLGYYGGDLDAVNADRDVWDRAFTAEIAWHPSPFIGLAVAARRAAFPRLADGDGKVRNLGLGYGVLRISPTTGRFTPYAQAGLHRTLGGNDTGYGPTAGLGLLVSFGRALHLFTETSMFFVTPDDAIDGTSTGSSFDQLGFIGFGIRLSNPGVRYPRRVSLEDVDGPRTVTAGEAVSYRANVGRRSSEPIVYRWTLDDGRAFDGREVVISFSEPGSHSITLVAENAAGYDATTFGVVAMPGEETVAEAGRPGRQTTPVEDDIARFQEPTRADTPPDVPIRTDRTRSAEILRQEPARAPPQATAPASDTGIPEPPADPSAAVETDRRETRTDIEGAYSWVLGSFADAEQAGQAARSFETASRTLGVLRAETPAGVRFRLITGRFADRSAALLEKPPFPSDAWLIRLRSESDEPGSRPVPDAPSTSGRYFTWVVASFTNLQRAENMASLLHARGYDARIISVAVQDRTYHRIMIGQFAQRSEATRSRSTVLPPEAAADSWILRVEP